MQAALDTVTSPAVLAFLLGVLAALLRSDVRLPDAVHTALSSYLLLAIGLKGGAGLRQAGVGEVALPVLAAVALGIVTPMLAWVVLRALTRLSPVDRAAVTAHYGSTSLVTFTAAVALLDSRGDAYEPYAATLLAVLEVPGILVGLLLAGGAAAAAGAGRAEAVREVLTGRSIMLLTGGLAIGALATPSSYDTVAPLFVTLFPGVLVLFLLDLGVLAGRRLRDVPAAGPGLVVAAVVIPVVNGSLGVLVGTAVGLSPGGAGLLGVLTGSASYIAAPAAVRLALPQANPAYYLTTSLGVTFPFNLVLGIPLYFALARALG
ncbi:sodium-dependent bicarbonate transport family permease [Actinotalea sp. BY-33]|uniref:Sodium-dependent bicarbonate transport family permease n=1 Tax=Actinotalea soli TaxID=2819234 RepID=A0A939RTI5_9CELL|nr:sodium-dependent bicarbonate transport family permease [Actinotalea soli]MBO1751224.1 sodium-dependent bicarbonate transport family permease [Actinotalea soli]